jgi:ABC-type glycerol-3-phosphate transport system substrate-binding protein
LAAPLNAGWSLGVSTSARQKDLALEFLRFSLQPEINLRICSMAGGLDPIRWSTYDAPEYRLYATGELVDAARAAVQSAAVAWPTHARWPELQDILSENLSLALTKAKTPKQALDHTQAAWQRTLQPAASSASRREP